VISAIKNEKLQILNEKLEITIDWYLDNQEWLNSVTSGEYQKYYAENYLGRVK